MPVKSFAANTNLLAYGVSTEPDPVGISPGVATLNVVISNPGTSPISCEDLLIRYPAGPNATDLTDDPGMIHVTVSPATWQVTEQVEGQIRLKPNRAQDGQFTTQGLLVKLADIAVNPQVGTCVVEIQEHARSGSDDFQWRTNSYQLSKFPYGWSFSDFAPKTAVVEHGNPAELTWRTYPDAKVPGVLLEMLYRTKAPVDVSGGPPFISEPLTSDTVFILRATLQIGGETVQHYQTLTVSVTNPALTVSSLAASSLATSSLSVTGNIGVGTQSPAFPLHLATGKALRIEGGSSASDAAAYFSFGGNGAFSIDAPGVPGGRLVVQESGNVGVGTGQPASRLHVSVASSGTPVEAMQIHVQSFQTIDNARASHFLRVRDVGTGSDCFVIRGDGGVGIGTADPAGQALCVQGSTWLKGDLYVNGSLNYYWSPDGVWKNIQNRAADWAGSYTTSAPSDIRLKADMRPIRDALEKVRKLQGILYQWGDAGLTHLTRDIACSVSAGPDATDEQHRQLRQAERRKAQAALAGDQVGLIAQDVEMVMPELVHEDEDGYKHIRYDLLTAVLIEAIKDQDAALKALSAKVADLSAR
jgi:hypothetical protein